MTTRLLPAIVALVLASRSQAADTSVDALPSLPVPLHEEVLRLAGDPARPAELVVTLYLPNGPGPFPLAVVNHGASGDGARRAATARYRFTLPTAYFLSRGYAVALPMMRGFAGSGGDVPHTGCDLGRLAVEDGRDVAAVIEDLGHDRRIDSSRVVVAGQSFGGWNTLGVGALDLTDVKALVNFNGGVRSSACRDGGDDAMVAAAGDLGARTKAPGLWFYGENDSLFRTGVWQAVYTSYERQNGRAELVDVGRFLDNSHQLLSHIESIPLWAPRLDAFLTRNGLPARETQPGYLPTPWPQPTHFFPVDAVRSVPWVNDEARAAYARFLTMPFPRVFLIEPGGRALTVTGGYDPLGRALAACRNAGLDCVPYAIDGDVVFVPPLAPARPARTTFASLDDVAAVPWIGESGRADYRTFLTRPLPRAFVIGTEGQSVATIGHDPLARAMLICRNVHIACRPYAVDDDVVWTPPPPPSRPKPTNFAAIGDVAAVPWVDADSRLLYARFLTLQPPRAFVVAPSGRAVATRGGYDPLGRALMRCEALGLSCKPYAIDGDVVWREAGQYR